jgi:hypothetical protein
LFAAKIVGSIYPTAIGYSEGSVWRMLFRVQSAAVFGIKAYPIYVEVDLSSGQKLNLMTVGLPDTAVRESSERVKAALRNCGFVLPAQRITINLAPADLKKEGPAFDLPMAVGILGASGCVRTQNLSAFLFMEELSLDGSIRPVKGKLSCPAQDPGRSPSKWGGTASLEVLPLRKTDSLPPPRTHVLWLN